MDLNKTPWKILLMVILFCAGTAYADADPEASPDPEPLPVPEPEPAPAPAPEPKADAEPRSVVRNRWGGQNTCEMTNTCCDMATSNCCQSGQKKCYTVWERKCDTQDKPECSVRSERHCHNIQVRECRVVTDVEYRNFNTSECVPKPLKHCFDYQKKICNAQTVTQTETITYTDQRLIQLADNAKNHCIDQKSYNCTTRVYSENVPQQVRKQRTVTDMQRRCRMVQKRTPDQEVTIPVTRVTYKTMCYNVPRSVCSQDSCSGGASTGTCGQDTTACSTTDFSTRTICPEPLTGFGGVAPGLGSMSVRPSGGGGFSGRPPYGGCQQVQSPVCTDSSLCNSPNLQCCSVQNQQVCKQVPQRIVEQVKQVMPGQVTWQEECQNYPVERQEWYVETVNNYVNRTKQDCQPVTTPSCHSYLVPTSSVVNEQKSENVNVNLRNCQISTITERYCHTFSDGDAECRETTVRKGFRITKKVCDQTVNKQECVNLPVTDCRMGTTANCQMVPRQVCQDTCSDSPMCKQCDDFRNGPGFGSCRTSTCGNYYPNDPVILPGTGGQGFYPGGIGGEGGYFPGGVGGEGQYPGSVGGEGSFSGGVGGEGYFPGGGDGYFQGGIGGENFYPGDQGEDDLFQGGDSARPPYWSGQGGAVQPFNVAPAVPREALD